MEFINHSLRQDVGSILELNLTDKDRIYKGNVGGKSIEVIESECTVTSYIYKNEEDRDKDLETLNALIFK